MSKRNPRKKLQQVKITTFLADRVQPAQVCLDATIYKVVPAPEPGRPFSLESFAVAVVWHRDIMLDPGRTMGCVVADLRSIRDRELALQGIEHVAESCVEFVNADGQSILLDGIAGWAQRTLGSMPRYRFEAADGSSTATVKLVMTAGEHASAIRKEKRFKM